MRKKTRASEAPTAGAELNEAPLPYRAPAAPEKMVRTQIYLNQAEYDFVRREAARRDEPMAAIVRRYIGEKMTIPEDEWRKNPLLEPTVEDATAVAREDGSLNHDHYVYGTPKKYQKSGGKWGWVPLPK